MVVRPASRSDAAVIARVHIDAWRTTYVGIVPQAHLDAWLGAHLHASTTEEIGGATLPKAGYRWESIAKLRG